MNYAIITKDYSFGILLNCNTIYLALSPLVLYIQLSIDLNCLYLNLLTLLFHLNSSAQCLDFVIIVFNWSIDMLLIN